jgi:hypothetical protein
VSPKKDRPDDKEEDFANIVAPPDMDIATDFARQTMAAFRSNCIVAARQCAVTGKGRSWCINPSIGPALQACHIIPQQHYHLYPDAEGLGNNDEAKYSPRRLRKAWQRTWSAENGILLLSHLHELFDARLFSIHPDTLRVRAFLPYDVICDYHGREAMLPVKVNRNVLRHHYDMCCIENMAANMPLIELPPEIDAGSATSGTTSPFSSRARVDVMSGPRLPRSPRPPRQLNDGDDVQSTQGGRSDQSKRADKDAMSEKKERDGKELRHSRKHKRRRSSRDGVERTVWGGRDDDTSLSDNDWSSGPFWEGCVTSWNSQQFLADVNWELMKMR